MKHGNHRIRGRQSGTAFAIVLLAGTLARAQTSNGVATTPVRELSKRATAYEQAGDTAAAVRAYEQIITMDATKRSVLSHRLVRLYAKLDQPDAALKWAREIMKTHPDPQAYLAGVLTLVRQYEEAEKALQEAITAAKTPRQRMVLHWQRADAYTRQERWADARTALESAISAVKDLPEEKHARRRLERFDKTER